MTIRYKNDKKKLLFYLIWFCWRVLSYWWQLRWQLSLQCHYDYCHENQKNERIFKTNAILTSSTVLPYKGETRWPPHLFVVRNFIVPSPSPGCQRVVDSPWMVFLLTSLNKQHGGFLVQPAVVGKRLFHTSNFWTEKIKNPTCIYGLSKGKRNILFPNFWGNTATSVVGQRHVKNGDVVPSVTWVGVRGMRY